MAAREIRQRRSERPDFIRSPFGSNARGALVLEPIQSAGALDQLLARHGQTRVNGIGAVERSINPFSSPSFFLRPRLGGREEITSPFVESVDVFACISRLADAVASIPLRIHVNGEADSDVLPDSDPVAMLFSSPMPQMDLDWSALAVAGIHHRKLCGEDFWFLRMKDGQPAGKPGSEFIKLPDTITPVIGSAVDDQRDEDNYIRAWRYRSNNTATDWVPRESVIQFRDYYADDPQRGIGAVEVAMRRLNVGFQSERYQEAVIRSGGPGAFLVHEQELNPDDEAREQEELDERLSDPTKAGHMKILRGKWTVHPVPTTPKDMLAGEIQAQVRAAICEVMGVPPPVIGDFSNAKYSNIVEAYKQFWINVAAYLRSIERRLNSTFFPRLIDPRQRAYRARFDFSDVEALRVDQSEVLKNAVAIAGATSGLGITFNEAAGMLGAKFKPPVNGDLPLSKMGVVTVDQMLSGPPEPAAPAEPPPPTKGMERAQPSGRPRPLELKEQRLQYVRALHARVTDRYMARMKRAAVNWYSAYEREQIEHLRLFAEQGPTGKSFRGRRVRAASDDVEQFLLLAKSRWERELRRATSPILDALFVAAAQDLAEELGVVSISLTDPAVLAALSAQKVQLVEGVTSTVSKQVKAALLAVLGSGPSTVSDLQAAVREKLPELTDALRGVFKSKDARALTIARTETTHAAVTARVEQLRDAGFTHIQWLSSHDDLVRQLHQDHDGEVVKIGDRFPHSQIRWPGDADAPAEEVINCRCDVLGVDPLSPDHPDNEG